MKNIFSIIILIFLLSCHYDIFPQKSISGFTNVYKRIILIGDAGEPSVKDNEPVLVALNKIASEIEDSTIVVFLGDNIYPVGLTEIDDYNREEYERRINEQINSILNTNATGFFIPGNHDWNRGSKDGLDYIKRQYEYINLKGNQQVFFKPERGCPGPEYFDCGNNLRIIFLDTQWWLQDIKQRSSETDECEHSSENDVLAELSDLIIDEDKFIIICGHHPLNTFGKHGGQYSVKTHLFPLTEVNNYLYVPLPIIGSLFVLIKNMGISKQDISNPTYKKMVRSIESIIQNRSGIVYASGHDHALQVLRGVKDNLYLVSGAGIYDLVDDYVGAGDETLFADNVPGFFILDFLSDGRIRLSAIQVTDRSGNTKTVYELYTK